MNRHKRLVFANTVIVLAFLVIVTKSSAQFGPPEHPPLVISEFRERGPYGALDEFVEIYNNSNKSHTVQAAINSAGYALVASDGFARCVIPTGTVIPARGHFLCVNHAGYSLGSYPAGPGTATGDAGITKDIPDNAGLALFSTSNKYAFNLANRIDAFGPNGVNALFREGPGYQFTIDSSSWGTYYRDACGKNGNTQNFGPCPSAGFPMDTDDNSVDFIYLGNTIFDGPIYRVVGTAGPENLSSPIYRGIGTDLRRTLLDPLVNLSTGVNRFRDQTPGNPNENAHFGTLTFRRTFTNQTNSPITALRFRLIDATTFLGPAGSADLRARSVPNSYIFIDDAVRFVQGTTLEEPTNAPNFSSGGGFNSSLSANGISTWSPLMPGASVNLQLMFGVMAQGHFRFAVVIETLPATASGVWFVSGNTETQSDTEQLFQP